MAHKITHGLAAVGRAFWHGLEIEGASLAGEVDPGAYGWLTAPAYRDQPARDAGTGLTAGEAGMAREMTVSNLADLLTPAELRAMRELNCDDVTGNGR